MWTARSRCAAIFPRAAQNVTGGFSNRLLPGSEPATVEFNINDSTTGMEDVLVIATLGKESSLPQNFVHLEQSGLERGSGPKTPGALLLAAFGTGERGGPPDLETYALGRLSWTVRKR